TTRASLRLVSDRTRRAFRQRGERGPDQRAEWHTIYYHHGNADPGSWRRRDQGRPILLLVWREPEPELDVFCCVVLPLDRPQELGVPQQRPHRKFIRRVESG